MARNRTRMPWSRGKPGAETDASFFEHDPWSHPRPDSPEVNVFSPAEEAQSHRRWTRALFGERLRGPMSRGEQFGLGLSAAAFMAVADRDGKPRGDAGPAFRDGGDVLAARKPASTGQADKAPLSSKSAGPMQTLFDAGGDVAISSPVSRATDGGFGARRPAPRSSGAPLESRQGGSAERAEAVAPRKAEQAPSDARGPVFAEAAVVIRAPLDMDVATAAIAMRSDAVDEAREDPERADAEGAKPEGGRATAEAPEHAKAKDAAPAAEGKGEQRQGQAEAIVRDKAEAPAAVEAKAADGDRRAGDAAGLAKTKDTVVADVEADEALCAADAPGQPRTIEGGAAEAAPGFADKPAKAQGRAKDVDVVEFKAADQGRAPTEALAPAKDALHLGGSKAEAGRDQAEAPEQTMARTMPVVVGSAPDQVYGAAVAAEARAKAKEAAVAEKLDPVGARVEAPGPAKDVALAAGTKAELGQRPAEAPALSAIAVPVLAEPKTEQRQIAVETPGEAKARANDVPVVSEAKTGLGDRPTEAPGQAKAVDAVGGAGIKADPGQGPVEPLAPAKGIAVVEATADPARAQAPTPGSAPPVAVAKAEAEAGRDQAEAAGQANAKASGVPVVADGKAASGGGGAAEAPNQTKPKDVPVVEPKADPGRDVKDAPGQANDAPTITAIKAGENHAPAETPGPGAAAKGVPLAAPTDAKADPSREQGQAPAQAKDIPVAVEAGGQGKAQVAAVVPDAKPDPGQRPAEAPGQVAANGIEVAAKQGDGPAEAPGQAKGVPVIVEAKPTQGQSPAEALGDATTKNAAAAVVAGVDLNLGNAEPPAPMPNIPTVAVARTEQEQRPADAPEQAAAKAVPALSEVRAEQSQSSAETTGKATAKDVPTVAEAKPDPSLRAAEASAPAAKDVAAAPEANAEPPAPAVKAVAALPSAEVEPPTPLAKDLSAAPAARAEPVQSPAEPPAPVAKDVAPLPAAKTELAQHSAEPPALTAKDVSAVPAARVEAVEPLAEAPAALAEDVAALPAAKAEPSPPAAKDVAPLPAAKAEPVQAEPSSPVAKDAEPLPAAKAEPVQAESPAPVAKDVAPLPAAKAEPAQPSAESPAPVAKDVEPLPATKAEPAQPSAESPAPVAKDVAPLPAAKAEPAQAEPPAPVAKDVAPLPAAKAEPVQAEPPAPVAKDVAPLPASKAEPAPPSAEIPAQAKQAESPAQGGILLAPVADAMVLHVPDIWTGTEGLPSSGQSFTLSLDNVAPPVPNAVGPVGANGASSTGAAPGGSPAKAAAPVADSGPSGDVALAVTTGLGEFNGADAARAAPSGTAEQGAVATGGAASGVVTAKPAEDAQAFALFASPVQESVVPPRAGPMSGGDALLAGVGPGLPVLENALQPATGDLMLL